MSQLLTGKLALITGAGSGIGRAVCQVLAREGAKIIATDQNIEKAEETVDTLEGTGHIALHIQVADRKSVETAFENVTKHFSKPPTIIVNSAGVVRSSNFLNLCDEDFDQMVDVNLKGTLLVMQTAVKAMIEADATRGSSIINISSIVTKLPNPEYYIYGATKAGIVAVSKAACKEFGKLGIRVNILLPGFIETPMTSNVPDATKQFYTKNTALQRPGQPQEVAELISFLASDRSSFVNGASIEITGGL